MRAQAGDLYAFSELTAARTDRLYAAGAMRRAGLGDRLAEPDRRGVTLDQQNVL